MGITVDTYTTLPGGTITTFDGGSLRWDRTRDALFQHRENQGHRRWPLDPPFAETAQILGSFPDDPAGDYEDLDLARSGYIYLDQSGDRIVYKMDPTSGATIATFGTAGGTGSGLDPTFFSGAMHFSENVMANGTTLLLCSNIFGDLGVLNSSGPTLTYVAHVNDVGFNTQTSSGWRHKLGPDPLSGKARWVVVTNNGGNVTRSFYLVEADTTSMSVTHKLTITIAASTPLFSNQIGLPRPQVFHDAANERVIIAVEGAAVITKEMVSISLTDWSTVAWRKTFLSTDGFPGSLAITTLGDARVVDGLWGFVFTSGNLTLQGHLIRLSDGVTLDSGVAVMGFDVANLSSMQIWDGQRGRVYFETDTQTSPLLAIGFDFLTSNPDPPTALPVPDTDEAIILRGSDLTAVMNNFGQLMEDSLPLYADKGGDLAFAQTLDMNGSSITNLSQGQGSRDLVTKAQMEALII